MLEVFATQGEERRGNTTHLVSMEFERDRTPRTELSSEWLGANIMVIQSDPMEERKLSIVDCLEN